MSIRAIAWDVDGTLVDSLPWFMATQPLVAAQFGLRPLRPEDLPALRQLNSREVLRSMGVPSWKLPALTLELRARKRAAAGRIPLHPGIAEALGGLHAAGIRLAIVSSDSAASIRQGLGPLEWFTEPATLLRLAADPSGVVC